MSKANLLVESAIFNFIKTLFGLLFPLITFTYSSRILGVEGIGQVNFARSIITYFTLIAGLGINYYGTREAAKLRDRREQLSSFVWEMLAINAVTTVAAYMLLFTGMTVVPKLRNYQKLLFICSIAIVMQSLGMEWLYQAMEEYRYIAVRSMIFQGIALILMFIFVRTSDDVLIYAAITVLASSGSYVMNFFHARRYVGFHHGKWKFVGHIKPILWLFAMVLSIELYTVLDSSMLGFFQGDAAVGKYTAAVRVNKLCTHLILSVGVVLIPRLSYYIGQGEFSRVGQLAMRVYNYIFMLSVPAAIGLFVLSDEVIMLLSGSEFASAAHTMRLLTPIVVFIPFSAITNQQVFVPMGKEKLILMSTCAGAVSNFTLNLLLIPRFAENGAAIATVLAEGAVAIVCFLNMRRYFTVKEIFSKYMQYLLAALSIPVIALIFQRLPMHYILRLGATVLMSVISYFINLYLFKNPFFLQALELVRNKALRYKK